MRAYAYTYAAGDQTKAVGAYHQLRGFLVEEFGSDPSPETEALYLALLERNSPRPLPTRCTTPTRKW